MSRTAVLGTGGHVDHGKTALVRALTGVETDRWAEEKARGLTIDLGFAPLPLGDLEVGIVDVPGHEDFLKNMLAGATGIDLLLLVVAADEGPMPQTVEHLAIARLLGVRHGIVALTKVDRVDAEWRELVAEEVRSLLGRFTGELSWPVVPVSSVTGEGLKALIAEIRRQLDLVEERPADDLFRMPIDRSFTVRGTGTVLTGTVWSGRVRAGDEVRILPGDRRGRVRSLQVHGERMEEVSAGRRCALALVGVEPGEAGRGSVAVIGSQWRPSHRLGARLSILSDAPPLEHGQRVRVYHGTREVLARVLLADAGQLPPGDEGWAVLRLERPIVARARDRFVLRFYSPARTIGGGEVAELDPPRRWRERQETWAELLAEDPSAAFRAAVRLAGRYGIRQEELPLATGLPSSTIATLADDPPGRTNRVGDLWFGQAVWEEVERQLLRELAHGHRQLPRRSSVSREAVRVAVARLFAPPVVDAALERLTEEGRMETVGPGLRLPGWRPALRPEEERLKDSLARRIEAGGVEPPTVEHLRAELQVDRDLLHDLLVLLREEGRVVAVTPEMHLSAPAAHALAEQARRVLAQRPLASPTDFKEAFGVTRRYLIPLLEYLDREGITRRTPEGRTAGSVASESRPSA